MALPSSDLFRRRHHRLDVSDLVASRHIKKKNLHRIADQRVHITRLIAVYGPTRRASVTSARCPDSVFVATLVECLRIGEVLSIENLIILDDISS